MPRAIDPDRLAALEEERRFLLRSLADLEREHAAGDVDEVDYRALKDGYTVRAAATMRAIEERRDALPARPPVDWKRRGVVAVAGLVLVGAISWLLVATIAERAPGQTVSGLDPRDDHAVLMAQAREALGRSPQEAAALYGQALEDDPNDAEALTYFGWTVALDTRMRADELGADGVAERLDQAHAILVGATEIDPSYPDPRCFLGVLEFRFRDDAAAAQPWVDECLAANPPADVGGMVQALQSEIEAELAG